MFRRLVATSRAPQIMVLSMLRSFGKIGPQIDQIWAWLSRRHGWSPGVRNPLKSSVTGLSLLVNCYLEIKFHKIIRVNPPPPPPPPPAPLKWDSDAHLSSYKSDIWQLYVVYAYLSYKKGSIKKYYILCIL